VKAGLFRQDLYYRLATLTIEVPPLRRRGADVDLLARHFVAQFNARFGVRRTIAPATLDVLRQHDWPGNVRELLHTIESAMVVCDGSEIEPRHLPTSLVRRAPAAALSQPGTLRDVERAHIAAALQSAAGHRAEAARMLGISERNLYRKIRAHKLDAASTAL